ncbi:uncharacterized protein LOC144089627 [Stigmatopora argus]
MLKTLTKKLRRHSLNESRHPFQLKFSYHGAVESDDSEGENLELAQIDGERRRNGALTPLAASQQHNQGALSPGPLCRHRRRLLLLDAHLDGHSSGEEPEPIGRGKRTSALRRRRALGDRRGSPSSDEEVRALCGGGGHGRRSPAVGSPPLLLGSSPPRGTPSPPVRFEPPAVPVTSGHPDPSAPYGKHRPSLDLEKMQQKMLLRKKCGGKTRSVKIRTLSSSRPPARYTYDPSILAFRSLSATQPVQRASPSGHGSAKPLD